VFTQGQIICDDSENETFYSIVNGKSILKLSNNSETIDHSTLIPGNSFHDLKLYSKN